MLLGGETMSVMDIFTIIFGGYFLSVIVLFPLEIVAQWKLFVKAGDKGWKTLIPFYSTYTIFKLTTNNPWLYFVLSLIPCLGPLVVLWGITEFATVFGKNKHYNFYILLHAPIFLSIIAFGKSKYIGVPQKNGTTPKRPNLPTCAHCKKQIIDESNFVTCPVCNKTYHSSCWTFCSCLETCVVYEQWLQNEK